MSLYQLPQKERKNKGGERIWTGREVYFFVIIQCHLGFSVCRLDSPLTLTTRVTAVSSEWVQLGLKIRKKIRVLVLERTIMTFMPARGRLESLNFFFFLVFEPTTNAVGSLVRNVSCFVKVVANTLDRFSFDWEGCKHIMTAHPSVMITTVSWFQTQVWSHWHQAKCRYSQKGLCLLYKVDTLNAQVYIFKCIEFS